MNAISMAVLRVILQATMVTEAILDERVSVRNMGLVITGTCVWFIEFILRNEA